MQLQEFGSKYEPEMLRTPKKVDLADVIVYVHDSSDTNSFSYISNLRVSPSDQTIVFWLLDSIILATIQSRSYTNPICCYKIRSRSCTTSQWFISLWGMMMLTPVLQRHEVQPDVYCRRLGIQVPVSVSVKTGQTADVFHAICSVAKHP